MDLTVAQLIAKLQKLPQDRLVMIDVGDDDHAYGCDGVRNCTMYSWDEEKTRKVVLLEISTLRLGFPGR